MVRFDKPCVKVSGAVEYFREHMVGDYLTEAGTAELVWAGKGAARLGLKSTCRLTDFESLCNGLDPANGKKLMVRDKGGQRRVCFFAQISAPKDVSVACLVGGDARILQWWEEAVRETVAEIEAVTATRVRKSGACDDRTTREMIAAVVTHDTNRALDPQLHTHLCIMNFTWDSVESRWKGAQPSAYYRHQGFFREVCYNALARRMLAAGYELESVRGIGFNIAGFPPELRELFSKRRKAILAQAGGSKDQDTLQKITAESRAAKTKASGTDLRRGWEVEAGEDLGKAKRVIARADGTAPARPKSGKAALESAQAHLFERFSVVDSRLLLREALTASRGLVELSELRKAIGNQVQRGELLQDDDELASKETLATENEFVAWANAHRTGSAPLGDATAASVLTDSDQREAVAALLQSPSRVIVLQGDAGTGKTTSLKAVVAGIEHANGRVFGCAPSSGAADTLRNELTADADTLQQLLVNPRLQEANAGRTIIVDEAGLISVRQLRDLCRLAAKHDYRLLLVGDTKQHTAIEAGDALRCLQTFAQVPVVRLTKIRRQQDYRLRDAVTLLARGRSGAAFDAFSDLGMVRESKSESGMFEEAARDYVATIQAGKTCLVVSPVWSEIDAFSSVVRQQLKAAGHLARDERTVRTVHSFKWTREEHRRIESYQPGDVLTYHRAQHCFAEHETVTVRHRDGEHLVVRRADGSEHTFDPRLVSGFDAGLAKEIQVAVGDRLLLRANLKLEKLKNGDVVTIEGFAENGSILLSSGARLPGYFREFTHGYATTSHASQGKTVDRGILLMGEHGIVAGNLKQAYVSLSRFRESQAIYTTDAEEARHAFARSGDRKLASEMAPPPKPVPRWRRFLSSQVFPRLPRFTRREAARAA